MSGGHWQYRERESENYDVHKLVYVVEALMDILPIIDKDCCGDTTRDESEKEIYDMVKALGEKLFGDNS